MSVAKDLANLQTDVVFLNIEGPGMVLGYFNSIIKPGYGFKLFFCFSYETAASVKKSQKIIQ